MFDFFHKKDKAPEDPAARLAALRDKKDWAGLAKAYYAMGVEAMDKGELSRAQLWLARADTIYSASDAVYDKVGEKLTDDCSERIGALEDEDELVYNAVPAQVEEKAAQLSGPQVRVWGLLSAARLVKLGERLSALPGCEVLGELGWAVDVMLRSMQEAPSQEEYQRLMDVCNRLYELNGKPVYYTGEIEIPGAPSFQVFDLNGMMGADQELNAYVDSHLRLIAALSQGKQELPAPETGVIGCTLLPDYYVRTGSDRPEEAPGLKAELARIWSDYDFVRSGLTWQEVTARVEGYKALDLLQG